MKDFKNANKQLFEVTNEVKGTYKTSTNLTYVLINAAGHTVPAYQPLASSVMLNNFLNNEW